MAWNTHEDLKVLTLSALSTSAKDVAAYYTHSINMGENVVWPKTNNAVLYGYMAS